VVAWTVIALSAGWVVFAYAGYALALAILRRLSPRPVRSGDVFPPVSLVIAVYDGERELAAKLENSLALDYPGALEVIVASDASTDGTDAIARGFADRGVQLVRNPERRGKESAQALGIARAKGEILVFSDVGALLAASWRIPGPATWPATSDARSRPAAGGCAP